MISDAILSDAWITYVDIADRQTRVGWGKTTYFRAKCIYISKTVENTFKVRSTINDSHEVAYAISIGTKINNLA